MVNDDGSEARLVDDPPTGRCPQCNQPYDSHRYIRARNGDKTDVAVCPRGDEAWAGGPLKERK